MKVFENFYEFITHTNTFITQRLLVKQKKYFLSYNLDSIKLDEDDSMLHLWSNTYKCLFSKEEEPTIPDELANEIAPTAIYWNLIESLSLEDANRILKAYDEILPELYTLKFPGYNIEPLFTRIYDEYLAIKDKEFIVKLKGSYSFYNENATTSSILKKIAVYIHIRPKIIGYLFDLKYLYLIGRLAKKHKLKKLNV